MHWEHAVELVVRERFHGRNDFRMPQQALRRHDDERLPPTPQHLTPQQVEILRRCARNDDLHVVDRRQSEVSFEPCTRMFRPLPFQAVGQQHDEAAEAVPFFFGAADKLIDDDLGDVGEIAELGFPHDQPVGEVEAVAVFKTEDGRLGERTVVNFNRSLVRSQILQGTILFTRFHIVQDAMALAECAPFDILSRKPHAIAFRRQRGKGERLGGRPIDRAFSRRHLPPGVHEAMQRAMEVESFRQLGKLVEQMHQPFALHMGRHVFHGRFRSARVAGPNSLERPARRLVLIASRQRTALFRDGCAG